jgi:hypothetical protein
MKFSRKYITPIQTSEGCSIGMFKMLFATTAEPWSRPMDVLGSFLISGGMNSSRKHALKILNLLFQNNPKKRLEDLSDDFRKP